MPLACLFSYLVEAAIPLRMLPGLKQTCRQGLTRCGFRCWTYETSLLTGTEIPDTLPNTEYQVLSNPHIPVKKDHEQSKGYFGGQPVLHPEVEVRHQDLNSQKYLAGLLLQVSHWKSSSLSSVRSSHIKINITPFKVLFESIMMHALSNSYNQVLLFR